MSTQAQDSNATTQAQAPVILDTVSADAALVSSETTAAKLPLIARTADGKPCEPQLTVGWSYDVFLRKNRIVPSAVASSTYTAMNKLACKAHVHRMNELTAAGFKTTCKKSAVWNQKAKAWDTAMTARVVEPDCKDAGLIEAAYVKAQARQAKLLDSMRAAAIDQGANIADGSGE